MKFFNIDLHISVIADIKNIFENLGHEVVNWTLSSHSWVFGKAPDDVQVINRLNWRNINSEMCDNFYEKYKHELSRYDGFIVTHTPCFSLLFEKFNKPIIIVASTRYEEPFGSNADKWKCFNTYLRDQIDRGIVIPISNNRYDAAYCQLFTERKWHLIPSLCDYTQMKYSGIKDTFLVSTGFPIHFNSNRIRHKEQILPSPYKWQQLADYKGVIHIPYNCSTMSIIEQYTANIPLVFPTHRLIMELYSKYPRHCILSQLSWNQVHNRLPGSILRPKTIISTGDPNRYDDINTILKWMQLADYYDSEGMPYITYFDDLIEAIELVNKVNTSTISKQMKSFNVQRRQRIIDSWDKTLKNI